MKVQKYMEKDRNHKRLRSIYLRDVNPLFMEYKPACNKSHPVIPFIEGFNDNGIAFAGYIDDDGFILNYAVQFHTVAQKPVM